MSSTGPDRNAPTVAAQAADWLARVQSEAATGEDWLALEAWLAEAPEHRAAFEQAELAWASIDEDRAAVAAGLAPDAPAPGVVDLVARRTPTRRNWIGLAGAVAAVLVAAVLGLWTLRSPPMQVYVTAPGQPRVVRLADGSVIAMNGGSRLRVRIDDRVRRVVMEDAEAAFDVVRDADRPFTVEAGDRRVRVVGTEFNVRHDADALVVVTVRRGVVQVAPQDGGPAVRLTPGTQLVHRQGAAASSVRRVSADDAFAWRDGRVVARDRRLEELVAELNRQIEQPIRVEGAARDLRFSGVLTVRGRDAAVRDLEALLPVRATREGEEIRLVSR